MQSKSPAGASTSGRIGPRLDGAVSAAGSGCVKEGNDTGRAGKLLRREGGQAPYYMTRATSSRRNLVVLQSRTADSRRMATSRTRSCSESFRIRSVSSRERHSFMLAPPGEVSVRACERLEGKPGDHFLRSLRAASAFSDLT